MMNRKLLYGLPACFALLLATGARAALVNFEVFGTVDYVDPANTYGLSIGDSVSATGVFDDSVLALGTGTIDFSGPTNSMTLNIGSRTFADSDESAGGGSIGLVSGVMNDLYYEASEEDLFGQSVMYSSFLSFLGTDNLVGTWDGASFSMTPVPVPAAVWLFGSGLLGLVGIVRRRR